MFNAQASIWVNASLWLWKPYFPVRFMWPFGVVCRSACSLFLAEGISVVCYVCTCAFTALSRTITWQHTWLARTSFCEDQKPSPRKFMPLNVIKRRLAPSKGIRAKSSQQLQSVFFIYLCQTITDSWGPHTWQHTALPRTLHSLRGPEQCLFRFLCWKWHPRNVCMSVEILN